MDYKRLFRSMICLLLVCAILVSFPLRAEAVEPVSASLAVGIFAVVFAMAMGVVWVDLTARKVEAIGDSMSVYLYQWGTSAEQLEEVEEFLTLLPPSPLPPEDDGDDDGDGDDWSEYYKVLPSFHSLSGTLLAGLVAWVASLIDGDNPLFEDEVINAPEGFAYYNGELFPVLPEIDLQLYPYLFIRSSGPYYFLHCYSDPPTVAYNSIYGCYTASFKCDYLTYFYDPTGKNGSDQKWEYSSSGSLAGGQLYHVTEGFWYWSNFDVYYPNRDLTVFESSVPLLSPLVEAVPAFYVGDIPQKIQDDTLEEDDYQLGYINYEQLLNNNPDPVAALDFAASQLQSGDMTYEEYIEIIQTPPVILPDPSPELDSDTLAEANPNSFLEELAAIVYEPFKWIWGNIKTFFEPLLNPEHALNPWPDVIQQPFEWIWGNIEPIPGQITDAISNAADTVKEAVEGAVVPDEDYLSDKVDALCEEFAFADSIVKTAQGLHTGLAGVTTEPPVIYIDLGAAEGFYDIGGKVPFIDMRWYARYKPTADALISAFLWIVFIWRLLIHLPGIISGASGVFTITPMPSTHTSPIGFVDDGGEKWRINSDGSATPFVSYGELLKQYREDSLDNPQWVTAFGRNPSYSVLQDLYTISAEDMEGWTNR